MERTIAVPTTIQAEQSVSEVIEDLHGYQLVSVSIPSGFQGTSISFQGAVDHSGVFQTLVDTAGNVVTWTLGGDDRLVICDGIDYVVRGVHALKIVSDSIESDDRTLVLHLVRW